MAQNLKTEHVKAIERTLANVGELVSVLNSMYWKWSVEIIELAAAESGSDADGLSTVLYSLVNDITDSTERCMILPTFPTVIKPLQNNNNEKNNRKGTKIKNCNKHNDDDSNNKKVKLGSTLFRRDRCSAVICFLTRLFVVCCCLQ